MEMLVQPHTVKGMHKLPNLLAKTYANGVQPNLDGDGNQCNDEADLAKIWTDFLRPKFTMLPKPKKLQGAHHCTTCTKH